jgi:hypothetical protein
MAIKRLLLGLLIVTTFSCKKSEDRRCFKSTGEEGVREVTVESPVDSLFLNDNFTYRLVPDETEYILVTGGENVISFVDIDQATGRIEVSNSNKCNFLRSFKKELVVEIHLSQLRYLEYTGGGRVEALDTLNAPDFRLRIIDGGGPVDLTLASGYIEAIITQGYGDFTLRGTTLGAFFLCQTNSFCNTNELVVSGNLEVNSNSGADMYVNASGADFKAQIGRKGNIYYKGIPSQLATVLLGEGQVLPQ